jgi:uncharacterized damage-inducible protein DinB
MIKSHKELLLKYLNVLNKEISSYKNEADLWKVTGEITNPPGNLCLHLCGNLQHYIGAIIGKTSYLRNRDAEFSKKNVSRHDLLMEINLTEEVIAHVFDALKKEDLKKPFPDKTFGENITYAEAILHCEVHFTYHLGQINYHRRILSL